MPEIFLSCDLGEWEPPEATQQIMQHLHMANIACGGHAGSIETIQHCQRIAQSIHPIAVSTGAHPGVSSKDRGRSLPSSLTTTDFTNLLHLQIQRYVEHADLNHIKLHGALYHLTESDSKFCNAFLHFIQHHALISIVCLANGNVAKEAKNRGLPIIPEVFLDRNYDPSGDLLPRNHPKASITCNELITQRLEQLITHFSIQAIDGTELSLPQDDDYITACIHSDSANSLAMLQTAKKLLDPRS